MKKSEFIPSRVPRVYFSIDGGKTYRNLRFLTCHLGNNDLMLVIKIEGVYVSCLFVLTYIALIGLNIFYGVFKKRCRVYTTLVKTISESRDEVCSVCLCDYTAGDRIRELHCQHTFHSGCVDAWFNKSLTCPLCRKAV